MSAPLLSLKNSSIISSSEFNLFISAGSIDDRSGFIFSIIGSRAKENWIYADHATDILLPDSFRQRFKNWLIGFNSPPHVFLDISGLTRPEMADIVTTFFEAAELCLFSVSVGYVIAGFTPPPIGLPPNDDIRPVSEEFAGWPRYPSARTSLIVGLGYEREKAEGACEYFDSNEIQVFVPNSPITQYGTAIVENNKMLLDSAVRNNNAHTYNLEDPEQTFGQLVSVVATLVNRSNPVILPLGPKLFFVLSLVVAELYKEVGVWHVTSEMSLSSVNFLPSDHHIGFRMELGRHKLIN